MKQLLCVIAMFLFISVNGQEQKTGIEWNYYKNWESVKASAKAEGKFIFVDCFATWCGPCKKMDKEVYPMELVGNFMNEKFICIKVQMDSAKKDNELVQSWYADAELIKQQYKISAFPSYLFFSPEGKIVHREGGYRNPTDFLSIAKDALDPSKQYYTLVENYKAGKLDLRLMPSVVRTAIMYKDRELANEIVRVYKQNYLDKLSDEALFTKENMDFVVQTSNVLYEEGSKGKFFKFFYNYPDSADKIMQRQGFSFQIVKGIIAKEEVESKLWINKQPVSTKPNWRSFEKNICQKYDCRYSKRIMIESKLNFYRQTENWKELAKVWDEKLRQNPPQANRSLFDFDGTWIVNHYAWNVFLYCNDKSVLNKGLQWIELAIEVEKPKNKVQYLDTRANLLYKLGRVEEAIAQELQAIQIDNDEAKKAGSEKGGFFDNYTEIVYKMKKGEPTWKVGK
jgi:thioredoxin-related protein